MCIFLVPHRSSCNPFCSWTPLSPAPPSQLVAFPAFSLFPTEIRQQIWSEAARFPRFVHVQGTSCSNPIPAILHVCSESRKVALPTYSLLFADISPKYIELFHDPPNGHLKAPNRPQRPKPFYLNYTLDTLQYDIYRIAHLKSCWPQDMQDLAKIKRVAVSNSWWQWSNSFFHGELPLFEAVEEIIFVMNDCRGKDIEAIRTQPNAHMVEWSEDGKMIMLRTGRLVDKFMEEVKSIMEVNSGWKPNVSIVTSWKNDYDRMVLSG